MSRMSRLYNTKEPSLIDEEMLQKAVEEQGPQDQAGQIAKQEGIQYDEVCQLRLDYRSIKKIDHLWQFTSLTKLQLDNNIIERIEGLEHLTNLKWLDLSFNNIEVIDGLNTLVKLEDLSLYNNRISVIKNMDTLLNLHILSIGNNLLDRLENVIYLQKFKYLRTLNLAGNPICKEGHYTLFVSAHLPDLVYLDYMLLDEQTREQAYVKYQVAIEKMCQNKTQERKAMEAKKEQEEEFQLHRDAFVEHLNGPYLFDSMYEDDAEAAMFSYIPGVADLLETFKSQMVELCVQLFEIGLAQHSRRSEEVKSFSDCSRDAIVNNQQRAAQIDRDFKNARRQVMSEIQQDTHVHEAQLNHGSVDISQLCDSLMTLEVQLVNQLEDIFKDFERNISDMVASFVEVVQGIFAQFRDLENHHHEKIEEIALAKLDQVTRNEPDDDIPDDIRMLFVDKDTVMNAVCASHDTHLMKIDNREDELVTRINSWMSTLLKLIQDEEVMRHRKRIEEIDNYKYILFKSDFQEIQGQ